MKSPSQSSTLQRASSPPRSINNLEARIKQRQSQMKGEMGNNNAGGITTMSSGGAQGILSAQASTQQPSQIQRLAGKIGSLDEKLSDAKILTDTKFTQLNEQMNVIQEFIDEDREFRDQLRRIRKEEIKQLEDIVHDRFEKEAQVSSDSLFNLISDIECLYIRHDVKLKDK